MFAIIKTGGKQYKVSEGDVIKVEKIEAEAGDKIEFDQVLMVAGDDVNQQVMLIMDPMEMMWCAALSVFI